MIVSSSKYKSVDVYLLSAVWVQYKHAPCPFVVRRDLVQIERVKCVVWGGVV